MGDLRMISTCLVQSAAMADSFSGDRIELTPWDLQLLPLDYIQKGLLLPKPTSQQGSNVIDHLKTSLSQTLHLFPPLAGRLGFQKNDDNTQSFFIDCNNLGAEFIHAVVHGLSVADILEPTSTVHSFFSLNWVPNCEGTFKPLLSVQVTELVDGYFIGCSMNHCVGDGTSFWNFINSWSEISRRTDVSNPPVFRPWFPDNFSYPIRFPSCSTEDKFIPPLITERVFHFTKAGIATLKAKANAEVDSKSISSLQALLAHLWRTVAHYSDLNDEQEINLIILVGARTRLLPPLPNGYFGNAVYPLMATSTAGELLNNGVGWVAMKINKLLALQNSEEVKKRYENLEIVKKSSEPGNALWIGSSPRFNMYGNDFGWGKPIAVRSGVGNKHVRKVTLFSGPNEGDIDIEACLPPYLLQAISKEVEFGEAVPTQQSIAHA